MLRELLVHPKCMSVTLRLGNAYNKSNNTGVKLKNAYDKSRNTYDKAINTHGECSNANGDDKLQYALKF